jgi:hypothetical protein
MGGAAWAASPSLDAVVVSGRGYAATEFFNEIATRQVGGGAALELVHDAAGNLPGPVQAVRALVYQGRSLPCARQGVW